MPSGANIESYSTLSWVLKNAQKGFYLYTATSPMQRRVADYYSAPDIAVYDYSQHSAPYSFGVLGQWAMRQDSRAFFVINMQIALREERDMINLNLSRDLIAKTGGIWVFAMTPDADDRLVKIAHDFYSFIRLQAHFADEGIENDAPKLIVSYTPTGAYYETYAEAQEQMERYADLREEFLALSLSAKPEILLSAALTLGNIAELYHNYGHYDEAMILFNRVKDIREQVLGTDHADTATAYRNIAAVYENQGDYPEALAWYEKALGICEKVLGQEHTHTAKICNNIAGIHNKLGNYAQALEWYYKALAIREKELGPEHAGTAAIYNNIAGVYGGQGEYATALEWYHKALAIREKALGIEHPDTASSYNNIAIVYNDQGNYALALAWYDKTLTIQEKVLGTEHPDTATTYNNIAGTYRNQGDYTKALEYYRKSVDIFERTLGPGHPSCRNVRQSMEAVARQTISHLYP